MNAATIVQLVASSLGSVGLLRLVEAWIGRRKGHADAADVLTESAVEWAKDLKEEAAEARRRADQLNASLDASRDKAADLAVQLRGLMYELDVAYAKIRRWKAAIKDPEIPRDRLVLMADAEDLPNPNGGKP